MKLWCTASKFDVQQENLTSVTKIALMMSKFDVRLNSLTSKMRPPGGIQKSPWEIQTFLGQCNEMCCKTTVGCLGSKYPQRGFFSIIGKLSVAHIMQTQKTTRQQQQICLHCSSFRWVQATEAPGWSTARTKGFHVQAPLSSPSWLS